MKMDSIITIIISILSSSIFSLILSTFFCIPIQEKKKYIFDEKQRVYESITIFAQIILFPNEARYSLGVVRYNIQELSDDENVKNALNDLKMAIPKVKLISKSNKLVKALENFIDSKNQESFIYLLTELRKDLYQ